jgi:hypothetical protein
MKIYVDGVAHSGASRAIREIFANVRRYWTTSRPTAVFNWLAALKNAPTRLM